MHHIYGISRLGSDPWAVPENLDAKRRVVGKASIHFKSLFRSILRNLLESVHLPFYKKMPEGKLVEDNVLCRKVPSFSCHKLCWTPKIKESIKSTSSSSFISFSFCYKLSGGVCIEQRGFGPCEITRSFWHSCSWAEPRRGKKITFLFIIYVFLHTVPLYHLPSIVLFL